MAPLYGISRHHDDIVYKFHMRLYEYEVLGKIRTPHCQRGLRQVIRWKIERFYIISDCLLHEIILGFS